MLVSSLQEAPLLHSRQPMPFRQIQKLAEARGQAQSQQMRLEDVQTELLRFEGRFSSRLEHAFQSLDQSADARTRYIAMSRRLSYVTTALDIAVGPNPEHSLFDMV